MTREPATSRTRPPTSSCWRGTAYIVLNTAASGRARAQRLTAQYYSMRSVRGLARRMVRRAACGLVADGWDSHAARGGRCLCWQGVPRRAMFSSAAGADHMAHFHQLQAALDAMEGVSGVAGGDHAVYHAVAEAQIGEALHRLKTGHFSATDEFKVSVGRRRCTRCPAPRARVLPPVARRVARFQSSTRTSKTQRRKPRGLRSSRSIRSVWTAPVRRFRRPPRTWRYPKLWQGCVATGTYVRTALARSYRLLV